MMDIHGSRLCAFTGSALAAPTRLIASDSPKPGLRPQPRQNCNYEIHGTRENIGWNTVIDCNQVFELSKDELIQKFNAKELRHHLDLPQDILKIVWLGVKLNPRVDEIHKRLLPDPKIC